MQSNPKAYVFTLVPVALSLLTICLSLITFHTSTPNIILPFLRREYATIINDRLYIGTAWGLVGLLYLYLKLGGYDLLYSKSVNQVDIGNSLHEDGRNWRNRIGIVWKYRVFCYCLFLTLIFVWSYYILNKTQDNLAVLLKKYREGTNNKQWPGWQYYYSDDYYAQTKQRLQQSRAKLINLQQYQHMLVSLKDLQTGIYTIRSWQTNHRLIYRIIAISYKSLGILYLCALWLMCMFANCCKNKAMKHLFSFGMFMAVYVVFPVYVVVSQFVHSIIRMNMHELCLDNPNSSGFSMIINKASVSLIQSLKLNVIEDPNNIYSNVCQTMEQFYKGPLIQDQFAVKYVFLATTIAFGLVLFLQLFAIYFSKTITNWFPSQEHRNPYEIVRNFQ